MLYEEFEKLNCKHIAELNQQNATMSKAFDIHDVVLQPCVKDKLENEMMRAQFGINDSCVLRGDDNKSMDLCGGYDCSTEYFYQTPDRLNTYHNYLVLQDKKINEKAVACTENHQYFRNWTRRKNAVHPDESEPADMSFFDRYSEKIPEIRFHTCLTDRSKYTC